MLDITSFENGSTIVENPRRASNVQAQRVLRREYLELSDMYFNLAGKWLFLGERDVAIHALELSSEYRHAATEGCTITSDGVYHSHLSL